MASKRTSADGIITIKKYANRRLYDTSRSTYITLDDLAQMVREGQEFRVVDARSDDDITHNVLTQIIMETEQKGQTLLPVSFLRDIISMYGDSMQAMVPGYLNNAMESFRRNQQQFRSAIEGALSGNPLAEMAKRNMEMFEAATAAFRPGGRPRTAAEDPRDAEIAALRAELDALKASKKR
jgi:polyhydroxyalkanoate synthesis repressor PhaR